MASPPPADDRKSAILAAALRVIIDVGLTDMTIALVAEQAGVSTALVHYHFSSKDDLILAAVVTASEADKTRQQQVVGGRGTATARLDELLCGSLPTDADDADWLLWIEAWSKTRRDPGIREVMVDLDEHELDMITTLLSQGETAGEFRCADPAEAAARLAALRDGLAIRMTLFEIGGSAQPMLSALRASLRDNLGLTEARYLEFVPDLAPIRTA